MDILTLQKTIQSLQEKSKNPWTNRVRWKDPIIDEIVRVTSFLPAHSIIPQRVWHILNEKWQRVICPVCNKCELSWFKEFKGYAKTCSPRCNGLRSTNTEYYEKIIDQRTQEQKKIDSLQKRRTTNLERYSHINVLASEKVLAIKREKFGTDKITETDLFKTKAKQTMLSKYGVQHSIHNPDSFEKRKRTCEKKYGRSSYSSLHISKEAFGKLNNKEWLFEQHYTNKRASTSIAEELKVDKETVKNYLEKFGLQRIRNSFTTSAPEHQIEQLLKINNIDCILSSRQIIAPKELDVYVPSHKLAIEYCGLFWHCTYHDRMVKNYHKDKFDKCNEKGIRLLTIFEDEWTHKQQIVQQKILSILGVDNCQGIYARKCDTVMVSTNDKQQFFDKHHIQGDGPGSINIGLTYDNELVACMSLIKQSNKMYTVNRFATNKRIPGAFSKLLSCFKNNYEWQEIVTFADLRWSQGNLYKKTGFVLDSVLPPDYYYVDTVNVKRIHKFNFRHKNLPNILEHYDTQLSEAQNTENNGWYRIYNCGLQRWVLKNTI